MKKWLWGLLVISALIFKSTFAAELVGGGQPIVGLNASLESKINRCKSDGGAIETNFKIVNGQAVTTYFCKFSSNTCDLDSYVEGICLNAGLTQKEDKKEEEEVEKLGKYEYVILEYRELFYDLPELKFTKTLNWGRGNNADNNLAGAIYLIDNVNSKIEKLVIKKPKFAEIFEAIKQENFKIKDKLSEQYIEDNIKNLYLGELDDNAKINILNLEKLDTLFYKVEIQAEEVHSIFTIKLGADKYEGKIYLDLEIKTLEREGENNPENKI